MSVIEIVAPVVVDVTFAIGEKPSTTCAVVVPSLSVIEINAP